MRLGPAATGLRLDEASIFAMYAAATPRAYASVSKNPFVSASQNPPADKRAAQPGVL